MSVENRATEIKDLAIYIILLLLVFVSEEFGRFTSVKLHLRFDGAK